MHRTAKPGHDPCLDGAPHRQALIPLQAAACNRGLQRDARWNNVNLELLSIPEVTAVSAALAGNLPTLTCKIGSRFSTVRDEGERYRARRVRIGARAASKRHPGEFDLSYANLLIRLALFTLSKPCRPPIPAIQRFANVAPRRHLRQVRSSFSKILLDRL